MSDPSDTAAKSWTLCCRDLTVRRGGRDAVAGVNLTVTSGECVALIGPNGAGKTTLMLAMLGLLAPARGSVELDRRPIQRIPPRQRGRWASYVPQSLDGIPGFTLFDVVAAGRYPHVSPLTPLSGPDLDLINDVLEQSGLTELADRPIDQVSGGERQKALIAAAVAQDAEVMFLDEPNTALDPAYQIDLARMLRRWRDRGRGVIIISHDLQLPAALDARVAALRDGELVADGSIEEILHPDRLQDIYHAEFETVDTAAGPRVVVPRLWTDA